MTPGQVYAERLSEARFNPDDNELKVWRVQAGLDCFELEMDNELSYIAYFPIIAKTEEEAKKIAQKIIDKIGSEENAIYSKADYLYNY